MPTEFRAIGKRTIVSGVKREQERPIVACPVRLRRQGLEGTRKRGCGFSAGMMVGLFAAMYEYGGGFLLRRH